MQDLRDEFDLTLKQSAAILGNIGHECRGFHSMQEEAPRRGRGGYGWCQWTGPRRRSFESWSAQRGLDLDSDAANYGYLTYELTETSERRALPRLRRTSGLVEGVREFEKAFLRAGVKHYASRERYAEIAYEAYRADTKMLVAEADKYHLLDEALSAPDDEALSFPQEYEAENSDLILTASISLLAGFATAAILTKPGIDNDAVGDTYAIEDSSEDISIISEASAEKLEPFAFGRGRIVTNPDMNPIYGRDADMRNASPLVKPGALDRHRSAIDRLQRGADFFSGRVMVNDAIAKRGSSREEERRGSRHFYGDAFDLSLYRMDNRLQMRLALSMLKAGFRGFGFGENILHVDEEPNARTGLNRVWKYGGPRQRYAGVIATELFNPFRHSRIPQRLLRIAGISSMDDLR